MLLINENVRHAPLARYVLQRILQRSPILHLVELHKVVFFLATQLFVEQRLRGPAVGAVGFREHDDGIGVDEGLGFGFRRGHGGGGEGGACEGRKEAAKEGSYCGGVGEVCLGWWCVSCKGELGRRVRWLYGCDGEGKDKYVSEELEESEV